VCPRTRGRGKRAARLRQPWPFAFTLLDFSGRVCSSDFYSSNDLAHHVRPNTRLCYEFAQHSRRVAAAVLTRVRPDTAPERTSGRKAQISNITAAKVRETRRPGVKRAHSPRQTVADVIRTCLGPKAMLKMILDPMGGIL
jgi:hypothetical protein